ncbi:MAG: histidine kinase, partial [Paenibacillaceae bacterium]|nr:histidine kinase [Paenibacillaceae bacterium]
MKRNSLQQKIFLVSVVVLFVVYVCTAWATYAITVGKIKAERTTQLENVTKRVAQNVADMFDQTEKIALLISQNARLLGDMSIRHDDPYEELDKLHSVENALSSMILSYPHIESVLVSIRNGNTYMFTFGTMVDMQQVRELNLFRQGWAEQVPAEPGGRWRPPDKAGTGTPSLFQVLFGERFVYSKKIDTDTIVTLAVSPNKLKRLLAQEASPYGYEATAVGGLADGPQDKPATIVPSVRLAKYGMELHAWMDDETLLSKQREQVKKLVLLTLVLETFAFGLSGWFAHRMVRPIRRLRRQVEDISVLNDTTEVIDYEIKRTFPASFRLKMFLYLLGASTAGTLFLFVVNYSFSTQQIREQLKIYYFEYMFQSENSIEFNLKNTERFYTAILRDGSLQELMRRTDDKAMLGSELKALFSYQNVLSKNINYLNVYDSTGTIVFSTINSSLNEQPLSKRNIYPLLEASGGETVYLNEQQDPLGNHVITIAKKIFSTTYPRTLLGYYLLTVNEGELSFFSSNLGVLLLDFIIFGENGDIIFDRGDTPSEQILAVPGIFTQTKGLQEARIGGRNKLVMFDELADTGWKVVSTTEASELDRGSREMLLTYGYMLLAMLFVLLCVNFLVSGSIARPIRMLMLKIRETVEDHFQGRLPLLVGTDEIAELSHHLYAMIEKIQGLMNDIYTFEVKNREIQLEHKKAELANLIHQINPHFLYNTMETIKWTAMELTGGENKVVTIIGELSLFLRYGIHADMKTVRLEEELAHVRAYLSIQQLRYGDRLRVKWCVDPAI